MTLLSHIFTNQTLIDVFLYFILNPNQETYLANIVHSTGKALIQVQRTLKRLVDTGLILKSKHYKKNTYKADSTHIAYEDLMHLVFKAKIFSEKFQEDIALLKNKVSFGFIYGSVAKKTNTAESDIDIFLIGNLTYEDAGPFIFHLGSELVQEVNVAIFSSRQFEEGKQNKNAFIAAVLESPKIWLFGDKSEFEKIYR